MWNWTVTAFPSHWNKHIQWNSFYVCDGQRKNMSFLCCCCQTIFSLFFFDFPRCSRRVATAHAVYMQTEREWNWGRVKILCCNERSNVKRIYYFSSFSFCSFKAKNLWFVKSWFITSIIVVVAVMVSHDAAGIFFHRAYDTWHASEW